MIPMIQTITFLKCDRCDETIEGCRDGHSNREMNTLSLARRHGWVRVNDDDGLRDYCPKCKVSNGGKLLQS